MNFFCKTNALKQSIFTQNLMQVPSSFMQYISFLKKKKSPNPLYVVRFRIYSEVYICHTDRHWTILNLGR